MDILLMLVIVSVAFLSVDGARRRRRRFRSRKRRVRVRISNRAKVIGNRNRIRQRTKVSGRLRKFNRGKGRSVTIFSNKAFVKGNHNKVVQSHRACRGKREITEKVRCDFNIHDLNDDDVIPFDEFINSTSYLQQFDKEELFKIYDNIDGNGLITRTEFRIGSQMLTNLGHMDRCNFKAIADGPCFMSSFI